VDCVRSNRQELRRVIMRVAAGQRGYFTAAQAREVGYSYQAQKFHADHGNWVRVDRGLFRIPEWPVSDDDQLVRWALWSRGRAVVSHATALAVHGLGDVDPARVHLSVPRTFRSQAELVVLHRQPVPEDQSEDHGGYRVSTAARAVAECAEAGLSQELIDGAVVEALAQGRVTRRWLRAIAADLGLRAELGIERALQAVPR
jgi:predicted transcriptional regulator of viral defense system